MMSMLQHRQCLTPTNVVDFTMNNVNKVFSSRFFTRQQIELKRNNPKRVIFRSGYGTGKTFLLKQKALSVLKKGEGK
jgi:hypothetical protein